MTPEGRSMLEHDLACLGGEDQYTISAWAAETFGTPGSNLAVAARALKEMAELVKKLAIDDDHPRAAEEVADVEIVLSRLWTRLGADRASAITEKMRVNRAREWVVSGGHGQHVPGPVPEVPEVLPDGDVGAAAAELLHVADTLFRLALSEPPRRDANQESAP